MDGVERFAIDFNKRYQPYPKQRAFHQSTKPYNFLGGAAGPGKTACGIVEHMMSCNEFGQEEAQHVHTIMFRRTAPKLESTLITRFRELIPQELYAKFKQSPGQYEVTWKNGATTRFGSMQHESDVWSWQGQWYKVFYDELCEFTFLQWSGISAWNRCPVSKHTTKDGAGNPIGIGAGWVRRLFVDHVPCDEMDEDQRRLYKPENYAFFPCTYLDNPIYANDPQFHENLMAYPKAIREALMNGSWDVVGGYFFGAFDQAENVCPPEEAVPQPWHRRWISGDWGFEHDSALYWHYMDDYGVLRTYKESVIRHLDPEQLAEHIVSESVGADGKVPRFESFPFKIGREQTMYNLLRRRIPAGQMNGMPNMVPNWIISSACPRLIECIGTAPRDEKKVEEIASYLGDDPLQGAGYGVYHIFGRPSDKPLPVQRQELWAQEPERSTHSKVMEQLKFGVDHRPVRAGRGRTTWAR
jgi:hypothetical protein